MSEMSSVKCDAGLQSVALLYSLISVANQTVPLLIDALPHFFHVPDLVLAESSTRHRSRSGLLGASTEKAE